MTIKSLINNQYLEINKEYLVYGLFVNTEGEGLKYLIQPIDSPLLFNSECFEVISSEVYPNWKINIEQIDNNITLHLGFEKLLNSDVLYKLIDWDKELTDYFNMNKVEIDRWFKKNEISNLLDRLEKTLSKLEDKAIEHIRIYIENQEIEMAIYFLNILLRKIKNTDEKNEIIKLIELLDNL
jgi:hypothetical protein